MTLPAWAAEKTRLRVDDYQIDAELTPHKHKISANAKVKFTALEDLNVATFELHNALRVTKVTDAANKPLTAERVTQDSTVRIPLTAGLTKDQSTTLTFEYEGMLDSADDSPVQGLKLASIGDDTSYLLYAGRWFPVNAYGINRFTADHQHHGAGAHDRDRQRQDDGHRQRSGEEAASRGCRPRPTRLSATSRVFRARSSREFSRNRRATRRASTCTSSSSRCIRSWRRPTPNTAVKEFTYYVTLFGAAPSTTLRVVEMPDDTVPAAWAPEIAAIASRAITEKINYRLLANTIAHQWWGGSVSPASQDDWWLNDGFARYSEAHVRRTGCRHDGSGRSRERHVGRRAGLRHCAALQRRQARRVLAGVPVAGHRQGRDDPAHAALGGGRSEILIKTMRTFASKYAGKSATHRRFPRPLPRKNYGDKLTWFFSQWLDSTGAPEFKTKYTIYRLGNNKGFRVVGEISQDLDLFRMPVDLKIDTDGKTEEKRIEVVGTNSPFNVETFGKPRRIAVDPDDRVLKNSAEVRLRASIQRGQELVQQGDLAGALLEFNKALDVNKNSSLAHYRIAEVFFLQRNYQAAANAYRDCLNGDGEPRWTEVWSHIQLGKIFDITGQRERAINEYRQALQTNDNTQGAGDEARKYLQKPYEREKQTAPGA